MTQIFWSEVCGDQKKARLASLLFLIALLTNPDRDNTTHDSWCMKATWQCVYCETQYTAIKISTESHCDEFKGLHIFFSVQTHQAAFKSRSSGDFSSPRSRLRKNQAIKVVIKHTTTF